MRNTFPDGFFIILLNTISYFVAVRKSINYLYADFQLFVLLPNGFFILIIRVK